MVYQTSSIAQELDAQDELAHFRERFLIIDPGHIYLDGNSLGRLPRASAKRATEVVEGEWGGDLVRGWSKWYGSPERIGGKIAQLIGAQPDEVIVSDSTTVNLFKLVFAALRYQQGRRTVVTDDLNFPSDLYAIGSVLDCIGGPDDLQIARSRNRIAMEESDVLPLLNEQTALFTASHVSFKSAFMYDMERYTRMAHDAGALVLWDLSHSVGSVPVELNKCNADLAVGCTYKYLNGGPGSPAFLYIRKDLQQKLSSPIWGWFGQHNPFGFDLSYSAAPQLRKFMVGTPPILSLETTEPGIDMVIEAGISRLRRKSLMQTDFLIGLWEEHLKPFGVSLNSPRDQGIRGSHVSFGHREALRIDKALIEAMNVVPDFRSPDNIRFGVTPLYTTFSELEEGVLRFKTVLEENIYERFSSDAPAVT